MPAAIDHGEPVVIGVDPAGPGADRTVAVACSAGAILDVGVYTDANAEGPVLPFIRKWRDRLKIVRVDSAGIGFYFSEHIRSRAIAPKASTSPLRQPTKKSLRT